MDSFSRTTLAEPGRLSLRFNFPKPYEASNLKISFSTAKTLQNSEIYNEIDTATLKCQVKIHTSAFGSLTAAMKKIQIRLHDSQENGVFFIYEKCTSARKALWVTLAL